MNVYAVTRIAAHLIFWVLLAASSLSPAASGEVITGRVVGIADGDTVTILDADKRQHKIRLDGIDAPERGQPFGGVSKRRLSDLVAAREVLAECSKTDRYGRQICKVLVGDDDAGLHLIRAGLAWVFTRYAKGLPPDRREQYEAAESAARADRRGLWADSEPMPPWEWRQSAGGRR